MGALDGYDLSGRTAIVTGAARGIGAAAARFLADCGAHVLVADIAQDAAEASAADIVAGGGRAEAVGLDVSDQAAFDAVVADVMARFGRLDVLVNNAAIITDTPALDVTAEELARVHAVNFYGVVFGSQAAARVMIERGSGSIVNLASGSIDLPSGMVSAYSTAKAAATHFSRSLAQEVGPHGVRVNVVAPGWIDTPMNERHVLTDDGAVDAERKAEYVQMRAQMAALGVPGAPEDIAHAILYLACDASRFVTGQILRPNGGSTMLW